MADPIPENKADDVTAELPICRICSCEAAEGEPLFSPCKCSGSMKYIHQECLVAWLAHSKKQLCEFCGIPFQFTKQYSKLHELPTNVLLRQLGACGLKCAETLLRICMLVMILGFWVPHTTTTTWNMFFWFGDGQLSSLQLGPTNVSPPSSPDLGVFVPTIAAKISAIKQRIAMARFSSLIINARAGKSHSLLGKVEFLASLSPFPLFNECLIYSLEGQILVFVSAIGFTLVIKLIEWVGEQQARTTAETDGLREPNIIRASFIALKAALDLNNADDGVNHHRIMELIGFRGPLYKFLFDGQKHSGMAIMGFIACLWLPYNIGRLGLILVANPLAAITIPIKITSACLGLFVDIVLLTYEYATLAIYVFMAYLKTSRFSTLIVEGQSWDTQDVSLEAGERIISTCVDGIERLVQFSPASHQALQQIKGWFFIASQLAIENAQALSTSDGWNAMSQPRAWVGIAAAVHKLCGRATNILIAQVWPNSADSEQEHAKKRLQHVYWESTDRLWAILMGYVVATILCALMIRYRESVSRRAGQDSQVRPTRALRQLYASMRFISFMCLQKLILPLYCGILIVRLFPGLDDMALRFRSSSDDSYLSAVVQWLIGEYFMFHLSLFISFCGDFMCKDVLRK